MSLDALPEVDKQPQLLLRRGQIIPDLLVKQLRYPLHRFHFHNNPVFDQQVESVNSNLDATEQDYDRDLALHMYSTLRENDRH